MTLESGAWFRGVLWEVDRTCLVLRNADTEAGAAVDGELLILLADVAFVQFV